MPRKRTQPADKPTHAPKQPDYYLENSLLRFTAAYYLKRGSCCGFGRRHCP